MSLNIHTHLYRQAQCIVIKIGSAQIVDANGYIRINWLEQLSNEIKLLKQQGKHIIIVSSGSVALGKQFIKHYPQQPSLAHKQAAAAIGQIRLCHAYEQQMNQQGLHTAQLLLTLEDCNNLQRQLNAKNTLNTLLKAGIIPIINENDSIATSELRIGDNDRLSAHICHLVSADILVFLSDIDGLYSKDPSIDPEAEHIHQIDRIDDRITSMAGTCQSSVGTGGMQTKIEAATIATGAGCHLVIANGNANQPIGQLADQQTRCSWFLAQETPTAASKKWLKHLPHSGSISVDDGAVTAIQSGKSLLATGITQVKGHFKKGDAVIIFDQQGQPIAKGICQYHAADVHKIIGQHSSQFDKILGYHNGNSLIHCDHMILTDQQAKGA